MHHRGERMHRLGKIALVGERQALARLAVVHQAQRMILDRQDPADRRQSAVQLFDEDILVRPAGHADRVDGGGLRRRRKARDLRLQQCVLRSLEACRVALRAAGACGRKCDPQHRRAVEHEGGKPDKEPQFSH